MRMNIHFKIFVSILIDKDTRNRFYQFLERLDDEYMKLSSDEREILLMMGIDNYYTVLEHSRDYELKVFINYKDIILSAGVRPIFKVNPEDDDKYTYMLDIEIDPNIPYHSFPENMFKLLEELGIDPHKLELHRIAKENLNKMNQTIQKLSQLKGGDG